MKLGENKPLSLMLAPPDLDLIRLLCVPWRHKATAKGVYRLPHAIYTVASPCQILRELLAGDRISDTAHAQFAKGLHFSAFH